MLDVSGEDPFQNDSENDPEYVTDISTAGSNDISAPAKGEEELRRFHSTVVIYTYIVY